MMYKKKLWYFTHIRSILRTDICDTHAWR